MRQILFHLPLLNIPIYGYGLMLFFAFLACVWLAKRLCRREGYDPDFVPDMAIWLFVSGILGGRIVYIIQYWHTFTSWQRMFMLGDGGLVLYGALLGGIAGYFSYYWFFLRKRGISNLKLFNVVAPCVALGIAFGRIGCLCTGCCYGNVAGESCPRPIHFPLWTNADPQGLTAPAGEMIRRGYQTPYGFLFAGRSLEIEAVEPGLPAADAGLRPGDVIVAINGKPANRQGDLFNLADKIQLTVRRGDADVELAEFSPTSIGLNPTQIYETISMVLLLFLLLSYYPYKRRDGELLVIFMVCYAVHRFLNEMLRTDTDPVAFGLTLSQNGSILVALAGLALAVVVWRQPAPSVSPPPAQDPPAPIPETAVNG